MNKIFIILLYVLSISGLIYTDDLYQNSDEELLMSSTFKADKEDFETLIFHLPEQRVLGQELSSFLVPFEIENEILGPEKLTPHGNIKEIRDFYRKNKDIKIKLLNKEGVSYLIRLDKNDRRKFPKIISSLISKYPNATLAGLPYLNYEIGLQTQDIKTKILPILIGFSFLIIFLMIRKISVVLSIFSLPLFSIAIAQFLLKFLYNESNLLSSLTPLINFVVILCLCFHLYYSLLTFGDVKSMMQHKLKPVLFMLLTTILGVFSLIVSDVPAVRIFAVVTSIALLIASIITMLFFIKIFNFNVIRKTDILDRLPLFKIDKRIAYLLCIIPIVLLALTFKDLKLQVEALYFFPKTHKVVKNFEYIEQNILKIPVLKINLKNLSIYKQYDQNQTIIDVENELASRLKVQGIILSKTQFILEANKIYAGKLEMPNNAIAAYALASKAPNIFSDNDDDHEIIILKKLEDSEAYRTWIKEVENILNTKKLKYEFSGNYYSLMQSQSFIVNTLLKSFGLSMFFVSILIGFYFKTFKDFVIFLLVNISPPALTLAMFNLFGLTLNLATIMTFSVSFGLIVDSTVHLIHGQKAKLSDDQLRESVYRPMVLSSLILMIGFLTFLTHDFLPIWQFGLSISLTIFWGFLFDYILLPSMEAN